MFEYVIYKHDEGYYCGLRYDSDNDYNVPEFIDDIYIARKYDTEEQANNAMREILDYDDSKSIFDDVYELKSIFVPNRPNNQI